MSDAPHPSSMITPESVRAFLPGSFPGDLGIEPLEVEDVARPRQHRRRQAPPAPRRLRPRRRLDRARRHRRRLVDLPLHPAAGHNFTTIELKLNVFAAGILGDEIERHAPSRCTSARARS